MQINEWEKISRVLDRALALPAAERHAYLAEIACTEGEAIGNEVKALLQADQDSTRSGEFLQTSALGLVAQQLALTANGAKQIQPNAKYGNYRILARLGAGGMGEVYLALDETLGRRAALKFLPQLYMQDEAQRARFEREARAASALNHPNILTVYEIGSAHGRAFIATEYVEGKTLRANITEQNLSHQEILHIAEQVAEALHAAHAAGLIHRDIKPENIMLRPDGYAKLLDFGLAKPLKESAMPAPAFASDQQQTRQEARQHTQQGLILGTPKYMSPEQARGETLDGRSDLWSLGATLYEMLTGNALFPDAVTEPITGGVGGQAMPELILNDEQKLFQPILKKAVAKELDQRYQNAQDFLAEIRQAKVAPERSTLNTPTRHAKRWAVAAVALLILLLIGLIVWRKAAPVAPTTPSANLMSQARVPDENLYWELTETEKIAFIKDAAQNIAKTRVTRSLAELKAMNFRTISFWTLLENNARLSVPLGAESQNYAPRFFAAAILGENPQRFGLEIRRLSAYTTTR